MSIRDLLLTEEKTFPSKREEADETLIRDEETSRSVKEFFAKTRLSEESMIIRECFCCSKGLS